MSNSFTCFCRPCLYRLFLEENGTNFCFCEPGGHDLLETTGNDLEPSFAFVSPEDMTYLKQAIIITFSKMYMDTLHTNSPQCTPYWHSFFCSVIGAWLWFIHVLVTTEDFITINLHGLLTYKDIKLRAWIIWLNWLLPHLIHVQILPSLWLPWLACILVAPIEGRCFLRIKCIGAV